MSDIETRFFVRAFIRFLQQEVEQGKFSADSIESLEVATQCLESVYELNADAATDAANNEAAAAAAGADKATTTDDKENPLNNFDLFDLYRNSLLQVSAERKEEAESLKNEGNRLMKEEKYQEALNMYNKAISLDATNPIYYCNRAAAFSRLGDYYRAAEDCKMSLKYDSNYSKAYGRLGLAYSKMNKHELALQAYQNALAIEPDNVDYKNNMAVTQQRLTEDSTASGAVGADGLPAGLGGLGPGFDFGAALSNPALVQMASRMMTDPNIQNMLSHLTEMGNVETLIETGRNLARQMQQQNPELIESIRQQMQGPGGAPGDGSADGQPGQGNGTGANPPPS